MRVNVNLECTECKRKNYSTEKNKKNTSERLELKNLGLTDLATCTLIDSIKSPQA